MRKKLLCTLLILSVLLPFAACTKPGADVIEPLTAASEPDVKIEREEDDLKTTEDYTTSAEEVSGTEETEEVSINFSDSIVGQILALMNDCNGEDLDTAVGMFEEFFGTELVNTATLSETLGDGPETYYTVYYTVLEKDGLRFNVVNFAWNKVDGKVCRVELEVRNDEGRYAYSELSPLPDVSEVNDLYTSFTNETVAVCGDSVQSGNLCFDEDSYWAEYEYGDDIKIRLEFYNYTEEGGNGLVASEIYFFNNSYYY